MQMEELQKWYKEGLHSRIEALESASRGLAGGKDEVRESIRRIAHALRGSGATYGFPGVSEAGGELEDSSDEELLEKTKQLIQTLRGVTSEGTRKQVSILIVEDEPDIYELLRITLQGSNRSVLVAENLDEAKHVLDQQEISLIILDLVFPAGDGRTLLMDIRQDPKTATVPIIVLSGRTAPHTKVECFALGADDYFEKPFDPDTLALSVTAKLQRWGEVSWETLHDTLTSLPNRASFTESFALLSSLSIRQEQSLCLAILDLDRFKLVNDTYGHVMGDEVLKRLAALLTSSLRKSDIVARWGGEEFVVLFPNTGLEGSTNALQKALERVRAVEFRTRDDRTFSVTFSAGIVEIQTNISLETAVDQADQLLYKAKSEGRNRILAAEEAT